MCPEGKQQPVYEAFLLSLGGTPYSTDLHRHYGGFNDSCIGFLRLYLVTAT